MNADPLFRLIADGAVELEAAVPETRLVQLRPGQPATLTTPGGAVPAHVRLVAPEVSTGHPPRPHPRGAPDAAGAPGTIGILRPRDDRSRAADRRRGAAVGRVVRPGGRPYPTGEQNGIVETHAVTVALRNGGKRAARASGVQAGDSVVSVSGTFVRDGDRVTAITAGRRLNAWP